MDEQQHEEQIRQRYDTWKRGVYAGNDPDEYEHWYTIRTMLYRDDVPWLLAQLAHERQRVERCEKALQTLDSILGNTIADEPENFRLLIAMQHVARAALTATPEEADDGS